MQQTSQNNTFNWQTKKHIHPNPKEKKLQQYMKLVGKMKKKKKKKQVQTLVAFEP